MNSAPIDLVFAMTGEVQRNARALRQLQALSGAGMRIAVLGFGSRPEGLPESAIFRAVVRPAGRGPRFFFAVHRAFLRELAAVDAALFHASDLYVLRACATSARRRGRLYTYDARECYAHVESVAGSPLKRSFWTSVERGAIRHAAAVWTVSPGIAEHLQRAYGIAPPEVQYNAPVANAVQPSSWLRQRTGWPENRRLLVHAGQMRPGRGCEALVDALPNVPEAGLVFLGYGPLRDRLADRARALGVQDRTAFVEPVPVADLLGVLAGADAGATFLMDSCLNHRLALPNKLFDYFAAGLPVLASRLPEIDRMLSLYPAGALADPSDRDDVVRTMRRILLDEDLRATFRAHARLAAETFDWSQASQRFVSRVRNLISLS